jgi:integrase
MLRMPLASSALGWKRQRRPGIFQRRGQCHARKTCGEYSAWRMARPEEIASAVVMALVGHESAAMSQRYTHVGKESLNKAAALPEL